MTSLTLTRRLSAIKEGFLADKVRTFIAEYLGADVDSVSADSHLTEDFGLDLLDIVELIILLEEQFMADREITDEPDQIEFVGDLIRCIEGLEQRR